MTAKYGSARYGSARYQASRAIRFVLAIFAVIVLAAVISGVVYGFLQLVGRYVALFPPNLSRTNAQSLLAGIVQIDGILLGFFGLVFASELSGLQSQGVTVVGELLKSLHKLGFYSVEDLKKRLKTVGTEEHEFKVLIDQLEPMRRSVLRWLAITGLLLIVSILWSFSRMANIVDVLSRDDLYWSIAPMFAAILTFLWGISRAKSVHFE
jgi:hypothetical protein